MQLEYFRFLLTPVREPQFAFENVTRKKVIEEIFTGKHIFNSGRANYGFVKIAREAGIIHARIGKSTRKKLYAPPDQGFAERVAEDWPGCHLFINTSDEKETGRTFDAGQMIAMEVKKSAISDSTACLRALATKINEQIAHKGFYITINPIPTEKQRFWSVVDKHRGEIKKIILTYAPPNIFNLNNTLENDLREANRNFNTTSTEIVLENVSGNLELPKDNELLRQSAEWIDAGNGKYQIQLRRGRKIIKSEAGVKTETFEGIEAVIEGDDPKGMKKIMQSLFSGKLF